MSGKHKRGGFVLRKESVLATAGTPEGQRFTLLAGVRSKLLEVNERLAEEPQLVRDAPGGAGYLAIVMPFDDALSGLRSRALSAEQFKEARPGTRMSKE